MTFWRCFLKNKAALPGLLLLFAILMVAATASWVFPVSAWDSVTEPFSRPFGRSYWLGSDSLGRDIAAGIAQGAKVSILVGVVATAAAILVGVLIGVFAGYFGGRTDAWLMRLTEIFQTIPSFLFAVVLVAILTPSIKSIVIAVAVVSWPPVARLVRGEFLTLKQREFVEAARVSGQGPLRIMFQEILPNCVSPIIVMGSLMIATAILLESAISFLGLGDPNLMTWGYMIGSSRSLLRLAWWMSLFPGLAIFLTVLSINLVGEGLNDALNPKLRGRE